MASRINQAVLQSYYRAWSDLVYAFRETRKRASNRRDISGGFRRFRGHSEFLKRILALNDVKTDYSVFEQNLKRRLVIINHRLSGYKGSEGIYSEVHPEHADLVEKHKQAWSKLMLRLADVQLTNEPLKRVSEIAR